MGAKGRKEEAGPPIFSLKIFCMTKLRKNKSRDKNKFDSWPSKSANLTTSRPPRAGIQSFAGGIK